MPRFDLNQAHQIFEDGSALQGESSYSSKEVEESRESLILFVRTCSDIETALKAMSYWCSGEDQEKAIELAEREKGE